VQDLVGLVGQFPDRLIYHCAGVVEVDFPAASLCEFEEHLAVHDGVGAGAVTAMAHPR
jgi:hypothetical protein